MSENIPPQQQLYPDQHAIQHAPSQRGPDMGSRTGIHHLLSGPHSVVCSISQTTINNVQVVFTFFSASYPDFRTVSMHMLVQQLQLDIIAKMCVSTFLTI